MSSRIDGSVPRANNLDNLRRRNLSTILELVHRSRAVSRSELTKVTGLNRSTVAALVNELVELGLVNELVATTTNQVGRPSPVVRPNSDVVAIAVNPEVDAVTIGVVGLDGTVHRQIRYDTERPPTVREAVSISAAVIEGMSGELENRFRVTAIGVAIPGLVRARDGLVRQAPHLDWENEPIAEMLENATGYAVHAANDASVGAWAERHFGAGKGISDLIYVNGGASGIGGGIIVGGQMIGGLEGYAGEFGHTKVSSDITKDSAGIAGTLEAKVTRKRLMEALGLRSADAETLTNELLRSTIPSVHSEILRQIDYLAIALAGAINVLNPQLIVLGGFLSSLLAAEPERLEKTTSSMTLEASFKPVRICAAELGSNLLLIGAGELAFEKLLDNPGGFIKGGSEKEVEANELSAHP